MASSQPWFCKDLSVINRVLNLSTPLTDCNWYSLYISGSRFNKKKHTRLKSASTRITNKYLALITHSNLLSHFIDTHQRFPIECNKYWRLTCKESRTSQGVKGACRRYCQITVPFVAKDLIQLIRPCPPHLPQLIRTSSLRSGWTRSSQRNHSAWSAGASLRMLLPTPVNGIRPRCLALLLKSLMIKMKLMVWLLGCLILATMSWNEVFELAEGRVDHIKHYCVHVPLRVAMVKLVIKPNPK